MEHYCPAMPNRKREVISPQHVKIGDRIIEKNDEVIGDQNLADARKYPCFNCDRLKPASKGARF